MEPLFQPFRALGYITDPTPFVLHRRGKTNFAVVSVGKAWQIYDCRKLTLSLLPSNITALACKGDLTLASVGGGKITVAQRTHIIHTWDGHTGNVMQMLVMDKLLLSLGSDKCLKIWQLDLRSDTPMKSIHLGDNLEPTCMAHPPTYLNKVLVGFGDGTVQLRNINSDTLLYTFNMAARICCIEPSPALDVVGLGLADGSAVLLNVKFDEIVMKFGNAAGAGMAAASTAGLQPESKASPCTCLAFRTGAGLPLLAAGGTAGAVTVWNLEDNKLHTVIKDAHNGSVSTLAFFTGEPVLMSSAADNSLKQHIFDNEDGSGRLLRFRGGHAAPPHRIMFYGQEGRVLLSASADQAVRVFSVIQDQQSRELSQMNTKSRAKRLRVAEEELKLPVAVDIAAVPAREKDWANVLTAHANEPSASTWQIARYKLSGQTLELPPKAKVDGTVPAAATAVAISHCGNFGFVGTANGRLDKYNMQSALHRGTFRHPERAGQAHSTAIVSVQSDSCNQSVLSLSQDGWLELWNLRTCKHQKSLQLDCRAVKMRQHEHTRLAAICCCDHSVRVADALQMTIVRHFQGHRDRVTDACISSDSKWVISAAMDATLRVWDIPSACCMQAMHVGCPITALSLAPNMELLATTHVNRRGIYLWSNQLLFGSGEGVEPSTELVYVRPAELASGRSVENSTSRPMHLCSKLLPILQNSIVTSSVISRPVYGDDRQGWDSDMELFEDEHGSEDSDDSDEDAVKMHTRVQDAEAEELGKRQQYATKDDAGVPEPIQDGLLTLSGDPMSKWDSLVHLDAIKARNKPAMPVQKPESAPFFLPTMEQQQMSSLGMSVKELFAQHAAETKAQLDEQAGQVQRISAPGNQSVQQSPLLSLLVRDHKQDGDFSDALKWLQASSPVLIEREIASVDATAPCDEADVQAVESMLAYVLFHLETKKNFDHVVGLLSLILKVHASAIGERKELSALAKTIHAKLEAAWKRVDVHVQMLKCLSSFFSEMQL